MNVFLYFTYFISNSIGGTVRKYCLDMAFQMDFKYLEDVISSFTWVPNDSDHGCKKLELGKSENNVNEYMKVCICNELPCNNGKHHRTDINFIFPIIMMLLLALN